MAGGRLSTIGYVNRVYNGRQLTAFFCVAPCSFSNGIQIPFQAGDDGGNPGMYLIEYRTGGRGSCQELGRDLGDCLARHGSQLLDDQ